MTHKTAEGPEESWGNTTYLDLFDKKDCVIYRGSLEFGAQVQREAPWVPGVYKDMDKFDCSNYYPYFGNDLLNEEYVMLPWGELRRRRDWLFNTLGDKKAIFIRPNRGAKIFTGKVVYWEDWNKDLELLGFYLVPDHEMCVVACPFNISEEFRFVVVDKSIISCSIYRDAVGLIENGEVSEKVIEEAQGFIDRAQYVPERAWVLDTAITKGGQHKVLETGSFSCSGLYDCPSEPIVREVSRVALEEWSEYYA